MIVFEDKTLTQYDGYLYAVIYWFEKLKVGKCIASNRTLADVLNSTPSTVQNSLERLEKSGCIARIYSDRARKHRKEIRCLISEVKVPLGSDTVPLDSDTNVPLGSDQKEEYKEKKIKAIAANAAEWDFEAYLKEMRFDDPNRHVNIIGDYWDFKEFRFDTKKQAEIELRRSLRAARDLAAYDDVRVNEVMDWLWSNADFKWTLDTVLKYINDDLAKLKTKGRKK